MNRNATLLRDFSPEQLIELFSGLQAQITELKQSFEPKSPNEYLSRSEVATLLKVNLSTIYNWCQKSKLKPYGIGNRVYFKRSEIEAAIKPI